METTRQFHKFERTLIEFKMKRLFIATCSILAFTACSDDATKESESESAQVDKITLETEQQLNEAHELQSEALILEAELEEFIESLEN